MADRSGPATGARALQALPPRQFAVPWIAVAALAAAAWVVTVVLAREMGNGPGTMGLALLPFIGLWAVMMAAMMLPSVAPVAVLWTRLISGSSAGMGRTARMGMFLGGYLLTWAAIGAVAYAALFGTGRLATAAPTAAKWLGVAIFIAAGVYQVTPWKDACLRRCRSPVGALVYYAGYKGRGRDLRVGAHHGATCAGCCWGLMVVLVAVGVMNLAVMAALAVVVFTEKLWRYGKPFGVAVGVVLAVTGVLAIWFPWLLPGLHVSATPAMPAMLFQGIQELPAGLLAASARLRADPAMRVHLRVPLALVAAALADRHACLKQRLGDVGGVVCRTASDLGGDGADVGAVQAQPDAPDHLGQVLLAEVSVGVRDAGLSAIVDRVDGRGQHVGVDVQGGRVGVQHLPGIAHGPSCAGDLLLCTLRKGAISARTMSAAPHVSRPCAIVLSLSAVVLVVAAEPRHVALVAAERGAVEPLPHGPEPVEAPRVRGVGVVDDPVLEDERAHAGLFA